MNKNITFCIKTETFEGYVITNPFMFGRPEIVDIVNRGRIVPRTVRINENDELFFTWNGKTIILKEEFDHFDCFVE